MSRTLDRCFRLISKVRYINKTADCYRKISFIPDIHCQKNNNFNDLPGDAKKWGSLGFTRGAKFATGYSALVPKSLESIIDLDRAKSIPPEELPAVWNEYHIGRGHISTVLSSKQYCLLAQRTSSCLYFVVPLWKGAGYTSMFVQAILFISTTYKFPAGRQPGFRHSYSAYHALICKLGRCRQWNVMEDLIQQMRKEGHAQTPGLFADIIEIYGQCGMPNRALNTFYQMLEFGCKPLAKHLNVVFTVAVQHQRLETALSLFGDLQKLGISPNTKTYNILISAQCHNDKISHAYALFNRMQTQGCIPDAQTYSILMQALCRKSQVRKAVSVLDEMLNKGYTADVLTYTTLLNSLCRKNRLREAQKLLNRMKVMGCNPDVINYNTVIMGFCREGRAPDAWQILNDMPKNNCLPKLLSYRTVANGLCKEGKFGEAKEFLEKMMSKGFAHHFSTFHLLINGLCKEGKVEEACEVLDIMAEQSLAPHESTWIALLVMICEDGKTEARELVDKLSNDK